MHEAPTIVHSGYRDVEQSSLDLAGGMDEELGEAENEQEENLGGAIGAGSPMEGNVGAT